MYFYLLLFFSKAIFWGEDWDPQKMLGTPIWSDMWVPGPRMKNPSAIPVLVILVATFQEKKIAVLQKWKGTGLFLMCGLTSSFLG